MTRCIELFKKYIIGDFDNSRQVEEERQEGRQIHPEAMHVNRIADRRINNLPSDFRGFFIIEESYYTKPDGQKTIAPHFLCFEEALDGRVRLISYEVPEGINKEKFRNDNMNLVFDFNKLTISKTFNPMIYDFDKDKGFFGQSVTKLQNNMTFTLTEVISEDMLEVMEYLEKDGKPLTAYNTPLIYERVRR